MVAGETPDSAASSHAGNCLPSINARSVRARVSSATSAAMFAIAISSTVTAYTALQEFVSLRI